MHFEYKAIINGLVRDSIPDDEANLKAKNVIKMYDAVVDDIENNFLPLCNYLNTDDERYRYDFHKLTSLYQSFGIDKLPECYEQLKTETNKNKIEEIKSRILLLENSKRFYNQFVTPFIEKYGLENLEHLTDSYLATYKTLWPSITEVSEQIVQDKQNKGLISEYLYNKFVQGEGDYFEHYGYYYSAFDRYIRATRLQSQTEKQDEQ